MDFLVRGLDYNLQAYAYTAILPDHEITCLTLEPQQGRGANSLHIGQPKYQGQPSIRGYFICLGKCCGPQISNKLRREKPPHHPESGQGLATVPTP